jgi:transcriptional regulator with XRE-family HTH domain
MGALLRQYRGVTGASQTAVGLLVGLAQSHVSALERGRRRITSLELFERFADGLGIPRSLLGLNTLADMSDDAQARPERASVGRRAVLRTIGMAATAVGLAPDELVTLLETKGPRTADPLAIDAYSEVLHRAASLGPPVQPVHIQPTLQAVLERLVEVQQHPTMLALRRSVSQLISDAACFVGWLHYDRGHLAAARAHFSLAADGARDADDVARSALVLASEGTTYSPTIDGSPGDAERALAMLVEADRSLATGPPHRAHAWLDVNVAARAARLGDRRRFAEYRERASELQHWEAEPMYGLWHWFPPRSVDRDWLDDYLCDGLVQLADPSAEATLNGIVVRTSHMHRITDAHKLLMELHIARGNHDAAAAAGIAGLAVALAAGLERQDERIRGLRARAPRDEPVYAELDAALNASASRHGHRSSRRRGAQKTPLGAARR